MYPYDIEYRYVHLVANEIEPEFEPDDCGEWYQVESQSGYTFTNKLEQEQLKFPFSYDNFIKNEDIISTLEAYNLEVDWFWNAVLYIYYITEKKCVNGMLIGDKTGDSMRKLMNCLDCAENFTIKASGKKKVEINDKFLIQMLHSYLRKELSEQNDMVLNRLNPKNFVRDLKSPSVQMWFAANRYIKLFENLKLPDKRAKNSAGSYKTVSYNKLLLISRLMYFTKMTRNDSFLYEDNSLKGILKQYKDFKLNTF